MKTLIVVTLSLFLIVHSLQTQYFWTEQVTGVTTPLTSVSNIDGTNAWVCGNNGTVLRTTNSGYNWANLTGNGIPATVSLVNIYGISSLVVLAAGYIGSDTYVYRTSNSGLNWSLVFTQLNGFINGIWFNGAMNGFMTGDPVAGRWSLWKTNNGGINWDSTGMYLLQRNGELGWNNSLFRRGNETWFGTDKARIYHSATGNVPWDTQSTGSNLNVYAIWSSTGSPITAFAGGDSLLKSTNGGALWNIVSSAGTGSITGFTSFYFVSTNWYIRSNSNIYYSIGGNPVWSVNYTAPSGNFTHIAGFRENFGGGAGAIYAVRNNGGISRLNYIVEGVTIVSNEIPERYKLDQNYPNPFNSTTVFRFEAPKLNSGTGGEIRGGYLRLLIYNSLGQEIASMANEVLQPGTYKVEWNGNNFPSGVYYYRLLVTDPSGGNVVYSDSKKMIMIK
jgi:photosystem II stability/assembly factor-like uncharacterized protein